MKKTYNANDVHQKEGQEQAKKLYRYIREHVKSLDDARSCARNVSELFKPSVQVQRSKFKDYCERLIFTNPLQTGRKGEELLWRKGFYEVVVAAKQLKKSEFTAEEKAGLESHINAGIGHYHHYILRLQKEFDLELNGIVDFINKDDNKTNKGDIDKELLEWANLSVHRSLVYLGDLSRYKLDLYPNWDQNLVIRYYSQALLFKPEFGMPHNQMGTLANNSNNSLDATYHYLRSLCCQNIFEGTENNLIRLFEKNTTILSQFPVENADSDVIIQPEPSEHIKRFISRFLNLIDVWWFEKKVKGIYDLCHQTNVDLQECMTYLKPLTGSIDTNDTTDTDSLNSPGYLSHNVIFKIVSICLLCIYKLQSSNSSFTSSAVAFSLAVYSQLVSTVIKNIQEGILNFPLPPQENNLKDLKKWLNKNSKKKKKIKRRRRKLISSDSEESSEEEENDDDESLNSDQEEGEGENENENENENDSSSFEEDDDEIETNKEKILNGLDDKSDKSSNDGGCKSNQEDILKKSKLLEINDLLSIITDEPLLQSIKIFNDWLKADVEILKSCGKLTRSLLHQITNLVNLINIDFNVSNKNNNNNVTNNGKNVVNNEKNMSSNEKNLTNNGKNITNNAKSITNIEKNITNNTKNIRNDEQNIKNDEKNVRNDGKNITNDGKNIRNDEKNMTNNEKFLKEINYTFLKENEKKLALPEDVMLKGIEILAENQREIDWKLSGKLDLGVKEQCVLRIMKMIGFGQFLTTVVETGVVYDKEIKMFVAKGEEMYLNGTEEIIHPETDIEDFDFIKKSDENKTTDAKGQLLKMKHMGQLWLTAEVKDLETRVGKGKASLSPYLVVDADSLILHTSMVKQLVFSRKFIVLVPSAVVSALDDLKSEKLEAREAIRWLESEFQQGNRFFRAQRPQERSPIPYIKYPKKRDKESQIFIQIIECCHYLAQQQKGASNLVTLLVGNSGNFNNGENKDKLSYLGLAQSAGVNLEGISEFYGRWKKTIKGKR